MDLDRAQWRVVEQTCDIVRSLAGDERAEAMMMLADVRAAVAAYAATADVDWPQRVVGMYDEILARLTKES